MGRLIALAIFVLLLLMANESRAETSQIKFICNNQYSIPDIIFNDELIVGISPLPAGCEWVAPQHRMGEVGETIKIITVPPRYARISHVTVNGKQGYSAGLIDLLS